MEKMVTHRSYVLSRGSNDYLARYRKRRSTGTAEVVLGLDNELRLAVHAHGALNHVALLATPIASASAASWASLLPVFESHLVHKLNLVLGLKRGRSP